MSGIRSIRPTIGASSPIRQDRIKDAPRLVTVHRTLDFDATAAGAPLAAGSDLAATGAYAAWGVTFTAKGAAAGGQVCAAAATPYKPAQSGANVAGLRLPASHPRGALLIEDVNEDFGIIRAEFAVGARRVTIQAAVCTPAESWLTSTSAYQGRTPYLKAYDAAGALLGTAQMPVSALPPLQPAGSRPSAWVELVVEAPGADIAAVEFSCRAMASVMDTLKVFFDTLTFEFTDLVR
jgi:hypothetical protein